MTRTDPARSVVEAVRAARDGDLDAFATLVSRERPSLVMAARTLVGDLHEAEDAAHDALVAAWRHLRDLRNPSSFGPWLSRILTRTALARRRDLERRRPAGSLAGLAFEAEDRDPRLDRLLAEAARLPEKYRVLIGLHYLRGHDYRETAEAAGIPEIGRAHV